MATLQKRNKIYYIVFSRRINGKLIQKKFSLRTSDSRKAKRLKRDYEELYEIEKIDPFNGWSPKVERKRRSELAATQKITLKDLAEKFVTDRSQANSVTKKNYERHLNMLRKQVGDTLPVSMISEKDIRDFCFKPGIKEDTQASYLRHLRVFFRWLHENKYVKTDVTEEIIKPKTNDKISEKIITENDLKLIFKAYRSDIMQKKNAGQISARHQSRIWFRPVVMTGYYAGLRRKEIVNLEWYQINFSSRLIIITKTKSGKERSAPMREPLYKILLAWHRLNKYPKKGLVFPSYKPHPTQLKMSKDNLTRVFKYYAKKAELADSISFHSTRHSAATNLLKLNFSINEVAKVLGHSSLEVTQIYEHLTSSDIRDKMLSIEGELSQQEKEKQELRDKIEKLEDKNRRLKNKLGYYSDE